MIDIHTHILPNVDDGSKSFTDSIRMVKESQALGVNHLIITPHIFSPYIKCKTKDEIIPIFNEFKNLVKEEGIDVNLYLGHEVSYNFRIFDYFKYGEFLTLNNRNYILFELPYENELRNFEELRYNFECYNMNLILAHIERYTYYSIKKLKALKAQNVYFQVNASSLQKSSKYFKTANKLLKLDLVDFIASDIHHNRTNYLKDAYEFVLKAYGQERAERIFYLNPQKLVR